MGERKKRRANLYLYDDLMDLCRAHGEVPSELCNRLLENYFAVNSPSSDLAARLEAIEMERAAIQARLVESLEHEDREARLRGILKPWIDYWPKIKKRPEPERQRWLEDAARKTRLPLEELLKILEAP